MSSSDRTSLGDRMKSYEVASRTILPIRMPVVIRVDGKAFHSYCQGLDKPFDFNLVDAMNQVAIELCRNIQGAQMAYVQSDEVSILVHGYKNFDSQSWFDNQVQKMVSVSASIAAATMTAHSPKVFRGEVKPAFFDSRVFILPEAEVCNYFLWRQQDCTRNSKQMLARSIFSHKECDGKNGQELIEMCLAKGHDWEKMATWMRRGRCVDRVTQYVTDNAVSPAVRHRWEINNQIPVFSEDRSYINRHLILNEQ